MLSGSHSTYRHLSRHTTWYRGANTFTGKYHSVARFDAGAIILPWHRHIQCFTPLPLWIVVTSKCIYLSFQGSLMHSYKSIKNKMNAYLIMSWENTQRICYRCTAHIQHTLPLTVIAVSPHVPYLCPTLSAYDPSSVGQPPSQIENGSS